MPALYKELLNRAKAVVASFVDIVDLLLTLDKVLQNFSHFLILLRLIDD